MRRIVDCRVWLHMQPNLTCLPITLRYPVQSCPQIASTVSVVIAVMYLSEMEHVV